MEIGNSHTVRPFQPHSLCETTFTIEWTHKRKNSHYISMIR
ncbi:hypothetical protein D1AOALGA4SA_4621 [Olavius algarvensis Delta 1 endosymbiont]|nr:hypothetical protein D1AOALGA4SA_4621 [Olavius algarvensis Delta 1 endosymbiont]